MARASRYTSRESSQRIALLRRVAGPRHWVFAALTVDTFSCFAGVGGVPLFAFSAFAMVLQLLFGKFIMPETKGVSPEDLWA